VQLERHMRKHHRYNPPLSRRALFMANARTLSRHSRCVSCRLTAANCKSK
jgi:hypothetical protein